MRTPSVENCLSPSFNHIYVYFPFYMSVDCQFGRVGGWEVGRCWVAKDIDSSLGPFINTIQAQM